jgi:predicted nucleotidyltransferase
MKFGLTDTEIQQIAAALASFPDIERAILYGSRAKGTHKPASDIDLTLIGNRLSLDTLNALTARLHDLPLPYLFDVSIFAHITNPDLVAHIERVGAVFWQKNN